MNKLFVLSILVLVSLAAAQTQAPSTPPAAKTPGEDYSRMYSFFREGEFVQITVEEAGRVTGFVSRYSEDNSGNFLDHFFKDGKLDGNKLTFTTKTVHGVWYEFNGTVERGEGKNPGDEAYYELKGTANENTLDADYKTKTKAREVVWKSFPSDDESTGAKK